MIHISATIRKHYFRATVGKNSNNFDSFINHISNIRQMIIFFKDKNQKSRKKHKNYKILNTVLESLETIVINGASTTSVTLSVTGVELKKVPISAGVAGTLSLGYKILLRLTINKHKKYEKVKEKDQQTNKSFDKLYGKSLQKK